MRQEDQFQTSFCFLKKLYMRYTSLQKLVPRAQKIGFLIRAYVPVGIAKKSGA